MFGKFREAIGWGRRQDKDVAGLKNEADQNKFLLSMEDDLEAVRNLSDTDLIGAYKLASIKEQNAKMHSNTMFQGRLGKVCDNLKIVIIERGLDTALEKKN